MLLTSFYFGLRVSEVNAILGEDVQDNQLTVRRLKNSMRTLQRIPATNGSPEFKLRLVELAKKAVPDLECFRYAASAVTNS
jgi:hypothetical protein